MLRIYPATRLLGASIGLLILPIFASAAEQARDQMVADGVSAELVEQNLKTHQTVYLRQMLDSAEKREEYVKRLYSNQLLEQTIVEEGLDQDQKLLETLRNARHRALLDALVLHRFKDIDEDLEALARERYAADPDPYKVRKKIKVALIYIQKERGLENEARAEIEEIAAKLNADPENEKLFYDLAIEHSDDKMAPQGGVNRKWLIAPLDLENRPAILQASFALDTPGQMTDIVESEHGYSIVRLLGVTPEMKLSFEEAKPGIIEQMIGELRYRKKAEVTASLEADDDLAIDDETVKKLIADNFDARVAEAEAREK